MKEKISIVFMGTADFAVPSLKALAQSELFNVLAVVTQPDRLAGRKKILTPPPIKSAALELGLNVLQPEKVSEIKSDLTDFKAVVFVVVAYGQILPQEILDIPEKGVINVHGSLLPKYRGASPIQEALLSREKETGVTIMMMDENMDHGDILKTDTIEISKDDTSETLSNKLSVLGANVLIDTLPKLVSGEIIPQVQDHEQATYTKKITKESGKIDWSKSAGEIEAMIRAYTPWPHAYTYWNNTRLIIHKGYASSKVTKELPGQVLSDEKNLIKIACGDGRILVIEKIQREGKSVLTATEFFNGSPQFTNGFCS